MLNVEIIPFTEHHEAFLGSLICAVVLHHTQNPDKVLPHRSQPLRSQETAPLICNIHLTDMLLHKDNVNYQPLKMYSPV